MNKYLVSYAYLNVGSVTSSWTFGSRIVATNLRICEGLETLTKGEIMNDLALETAPVIIAITKLDE